MKLKSVTWTDAMSFGGPMSGKTSNEKDFESIELDRGRTTVALTPRGGDVVFLVPFTRAAVAVCSLEDFTAPAKAEASAKGK